MTFQIRKAERARVKARIGIAGPSGSGKTYSSLLLMRGLVGPQGRIVVVDTEQDSSCMYEGLTAFDVLTLDPPYTPERYMSALDEVDRAGYDGVIVDQITNEWNGPGGILEFVDTAKSGSGKQAGFSAWKIATPKHRRFVERLLRQNGHLIATMRTKVEWVIEKDRDGKNTPRKVGLAPEQRDSIEYEFQIMLDLSTENVASVSKDRTGTLYGEFFKPNVEVGGKIAEFLASGKLIAAPAKTAAPAPEAAEAASDGPLIGPDDAQALVKTARDGGLSKSEYSKLLKSVGGASSTEKLPAAKLPEMLAALNKAASAKADVPF